MDVVVREARESELDEIGAVTAAVYDGLVMPEYLDVLRDARSRWQYPATTLLVALDDDTDGILGTVAYAAPGSPLQDLALGDEAEFRMLGVLESARGRGVGECLVRACITRAWAEGRPRLVLSTGEELNAAHRLYERLGFARATDRDWNAAGGVCLRAYVLDPVGRITYCGACGEPADDTAAHTRCAVRLNLEPPRYCARCRRRMVVQVMPTGWTARCSAHGLTGSRG